MAFPPEIQRWLDLADGANRLGHDDRSYASRGSSVVGRAIDALHAYEHTLSALTRRRAREALWHRDFPAVPLPIDRGWWEWCLCRKCHADRLPAVYDVQLAALGKQRRS